MNATATEARFVQVPAGLLPSLVRALAQGRTGIDAVTLLRQVGYETGEAVHEGILEHVSRAHPGQDPTEMEPERFWEAASGFFEGMGWGSVRLAEPHPAVGALELDGWFEQGTDEGVPPGCHLTTGLFADLLRRLAGGDVAVMEVETGPRPRLLIGSQETLGRIYGEMVNGTPWAQAVARLG